MFLGIGRLHELISSCHEDNDGEEFLISSEIPT
jgi:hypothetical protein